jgi:hypothetical protein
MEAGQRARLLRLSEHERIVGMKQYEPHIPPAQPMQSIGPNAWYATAQVRLLTTLHDRHYIRVRGEWHGKTKAEAEAKARRAAEAWIAARSE